MSELDKLQTVLDALDPTQRSALLNAARKIALTPEVRVVVPSVQTKYWYITDGYFECYIDMRDAETHQDALKVARNSLTPWYRKNETDLLNSFIIKDVSREEYIKFLRR